jgi:two-component system, NarL family, response regulator DevR
VTITLFVVDDHEMMRVGIREALRQESDIEIVGEASGYEQALEGIETSSPQVALLDVRLPGGLNGIELCREVIERTDSTRCLMYTSASEDDALHESILAGASGYLLKGASRAELVGAIRALASGGSLIDPVLTSKVLAKLRSAPATAASTLTEQEANVLDLIAEGLDNKEIADRMFLAEQTVKNYVSRVLMKLDMRRTQAALYAAGLRKDEPKPEM